MERLYQYLWKYSMFKRELTLTDGRRIKIISTGKFNTDSGPDFSDARIEFDGNVWCGNVEIHVRGSDWFRHHHDRDKAYNNVILHVVAINDTFAVSESGCKIPQVEVTFPREFYSLYSSLSNGIRDVKCKHFISLLDPLCISDWLSSLAVERMQQKARHILDINAHFNGDWETTCFITFSRALGFGLNSEPFEMVSRSLSLNILARHSDNLFQLEALLFGQAGMLDMNNHIFDEYYQSLCREYYFLSRKYDLRPIRLELWKYSKTRPGNFPHRRLAMLAQYLYGGFSLMADILSSADDVEKCRELFVMDLDGYWKEHVQFGTDAGTAPVRMTKGSVDLLLINLVAPLVYAHCCSVGEYERGERVFDILMELPPEQNTYIRQWSQSGIKCEDAMHSQALLQLRKAYCDENRCLECRFGHTLLRKSVNRWE